MKVTKLSLKMFLDSIKALEASGEDLRSKANIWLEFQRQRELGWSPDPDRVWAARKNLETALDSYREQLSHTYDLQGDKGLVNFVPTGEYVEDPLV